MEIVQAHSGTDLQSRLRRGMSSGTDAANRIAQRAGAAAVGGLLLGPLGVVVGAVAFGNREVPVLCVIKDGKFFLAHVSMMNYQWLVQQSLMDNAANRFRSADFAEATMALCALVASADGIVDNAEKERVELLIASNELLKIFPPSELKQKFTTYCTKLSQNATLGKNQATQAIAKLAGKEDQARAVIHIGISVGSADGDFDRSEQKVVTDVCSLLGLYPGEFGLFYT